MPEPTRAADPAAQDVDPARLPDPGLFVAVVGPSGAGKDTLLDRARSALAQDARFVFARRVVTRPMRAGDEDHATLTPEAFAAAEAAGRFCLTWRAHDLAYGLEADLETAYHAGRVVVANVSRRVLALAVEVFPRLAVVEITAPRAVLAERIAARGREPREAIEARLDRDPAVQTPPGTCEQLRVVNDATPESGGTRLVDGLRRLAGIPGRDPASDEGAAATGGD